MGQCRERDVQASLDQYRMHLEVLRIFWEGAAGYGELAQGLSRTAPQATHALQRRAGLRVVWTLDRGNPIQVYGLAALCLQFGKLRCFEETCFCVSLDPAFGVLDPHVGVMLVALSDNWQRVGDMAARTVVVNVRTGGKAS